MRYEAKVLFIMDEAMNYIPEPVNYHKLRKMAEECATNIMKHRLRIKTHVSPIEIAGKHIASEITGHKIW